MTDLEAFAKLVPLDHGLVRGVDEPSQRDDPGVRRREPPASRPR